MQQTKRFAPRPKIEETKPRAVKREPARLRRLYVWEVPVRAVHWVIFLSIVILSITGYYLHNPFMTVGSQGGYFLATVRFVHEVTAFVFTMAFLTRIYWAFMGNEYSHWRAFLPISKAQWRGIWRMLKYYLFLRWRAPSEVGHNPLAAVAYLGIYTLFLIQILTGFALYSNVVGTGIWHTLFGWLPGVVNIQIQREVHFFIMFMLIGFTIHHIYSAWLVSNETKNGTMGSMFSGYKYVTDEELNEFTVNRNGKSKRTAVSTSELPQTVVITPDDGNK